jgi:hypothetical protein
VYVHIVLGKLKDPSDEVFAVVEGSFAEHMPQIPGVVHFEVRRNMGPSRFGYDFALISHMDTEEALFSYYDHPHHKATSTVVFPLCERNAVLDYED